MYIVHSTIEAAANSNYNDTTTEMPTGDHAWVGLAVVASIFLVSLFSKDAL